MNIRLLKPAVLAGFSFLVSVSSSAQDFVDVEAEKQAQRRAREAQRAATQPVPAQSVPVETIGIGAAAQSAQSTGDATYQSGSEYGGIRPYSGTTRVITPVTAAPPPVTSSAPSNMGDLVIMVQQLEADVRRLNGIVEEQAAMLSRLEAQSLERYVDLDRRLAGSAAAGVVTPATGAQDMTVGVQTVPGQSAGQTGPAAQPGEEAAYRAAYEQVRNRRFDAAVSDFQAFLSEYPFGQYAPNAHYWLGELYLVIDPPDPELARQSFKLLLDQYPSNAKVPDALYKLGRVHFLKGNRDRSREYLDRVIAEYGGDNHPAAALARDFLTENF